MFLYAKRLLINKVLIGELLAFNVLLSYAEWVIFTENIEKQHQKMHHWSTIAFFRQHLHWEMTQGSCQTTVLLL